MLRPLDQRGDEQRQRERSERHAGQVEAFARPVLRFWQDGATEERCAESDRQVDEKNHAPAEAGQIRIDQKSADDLSGNSAEAECQAEPAERAAAFRFRGAAGAQHGVDLRRQDRGHCALHKAGGDERDGGGREPAQERGQREANEAEQEDALAAVDVPQPPTGDEQDAIAHRITGEHELEVTDGRVQVVGDTRQGDVGDHRVQQGHEHASEKDGESEP